MTLGEKIDRALDIADLSITELSEAIDVQPRLIRSLMEDKAKPAHAIHEEQSDAIRAWEKQMDQDRRKRWRK